MRMEMNKVRISNSINLSKYLKRNKYLFISSGLYRLLIRIKYRKMWGGFLKGSPRYVTKLRNNDWDYSQNLQQKQQRIAYLKDFTSILCILQITCTSEADRKELPTKTLCVMKDSNKHKTEFHVSIINI